MSELPLPDSGAYELLLWLLRLRRRVRVTGASMIPILAADDEVLVDTRAYVGRSPDVGEIVVARRPDREDVVMVKRVAGRLSDGSLILHGDNPAASTDSHDFGPVAPEHLVGKVTSRFA
jgi:nickel-type superoxide dismutase maturation protease